MPSFEKAIDAATPDAIHKAMQDFVVPDHFVTVKAGDFKYRPRIGRSVGRRRPVDALTIVAQASILSADGNS